MPKKKTSFLLIPVCCLQTVWKETDPFDTLKDIGIYVSARKNYFISKNEMAKTLIDNYDFIDDYDQTGMTINTGKELHKIYNLLTNEYEYNQEYAIQSLSRHYYYILDQWCRIVYMLHDYKIRPYEPCEIFNNAYTHLVHKFDDEGMENYEIYDEPPYCLVSTPVIDNFVCSDTHNISIDNMRHAMFLGIASIVTSSAFKITTSDMIKARMFGFNTPQELKKYYESDEHQKFKNIYDKYTTRRRYDYMLKDLKIEGLIGEVPYRRRTVVSLRIKDDLELLEAVTNSTKSHKRKVVSENVMAALALHKHRQ